ncbi:MAG: acetate--CoA ligase [Desulfomonilaceae bacterium]|nr:acetate--CoA ligase [Desulfomonilaceae bacterium]
MGNGPTRYDRHVTFSGQTAFIKSVEEYEQVYNRSVEEVESFWGESAREYLSWDRAWDFVLRHDLEEARIQWFGGGLLNASYNCLDRHLDTRGDTTAYYWEGDSPSEHRAIAYSELHRSVCELAALLKARGVGRGDRVIIYMPMIVELVVAMLACARIGAVHCVVCTEFGVESLADRIDLIRSVAVVTSDGGLRGGAVFPVKPTVDEALTRCTGVHTVVVFNRCGLNPDMRNERDIWWHEAVPGTSPTGWVAPEPMNAEDPLFIAFAGTNTGKPKALVHTHGGYLLWAAMTSRLIFNLSENDVFWFTGNLGKVVGQSLGVYGPLINGVSSVLFEGVSNYPDYDRYWRIVEKLCVGKFCTEPHEIRVLASRGKEHAAGHDLSSLRILGSCGEALSPETWWWYFEHVGGGRCPVMNMWSQSESGGPMLSPFPGVGPVKPGSVSFPFLGVKPVVLDLNTGEETKFPGQEGAFFIGKPWPGMARTIFEDHQSYIETYFAPFQALFITGDGAKIDEDGCYWITGRIDDVLKVAGHRIGAWEIETVLVEHDGVVEAAVVGFPHPIKGQGLYAFVTVGPGVEKSDALNRELRDFLRSRIGVMAVPDALQWAEDLPKTRSGKILRRLLQKIALGEVDDLGDTATVANPAAIEALIRNRIGVPDGGG